jgi:hypothetical protein
MSYRLERITPAERAELSCVCVLFAGQYGVMTALARGYGVSRRWLYRLRARAHAALGQEVAPRRPGPRSVERHLVVDRRALERAVLVLHQGASASVRAIQTCLAELLEVRRSVGWVQGVLATAAQRARALQPSPAGPLRALADETYAGRRPVLAVVDQPSGLVALLEPVEAADETTWGCAWLELAARGVTARSVTADRAGGLAAGARAAGLPAVHLDHWHALRDVGRVAKRLEGAAYRALAAAEHAIRAAAEARRAAVRGRRRVGRPLKAPTGPAGVAAAVQAADDAVARADAVATVRGWVQATLRPVDGRTGRVRTSAAVTAELTAAAALLQELGGQAAEAARPLERYAAGLAAYLDDLAGALAGPRAALGEATVTFLAWAWCHRRTLGLTDAAEAWPTAPDAARATWAALDGARRGSGLVENLNSILAFQRATRRGLPGTALALAAVYRNHHRFARGKRAGFTPLELAGLPSPHWLDALGYGRSVPSPPVNFRPDRAHTVTSMAA